LRPDAEEQSGNREQKIQWIKTVKHKLVSMDSASAVFIQLAVGVPTQFAPKLAVFLLAERIFGVSVAHVGQNFWRKHGARRPFNCHLIVI